MTRGEHLEWAKQRALDYLPINPNEAMASFISDLGKHPELGNHPVKELMFMHAMSNLLDEKTCRDLIKGAN